MADIRVDCITLRSGSVSHEGITHVGGPGNGTRWKLPRQDVVNQINNRSNTYYTLVDGNRGDIGVVHGANGDYLRTFADGRPNDNLLSLKSCG